MSSGGLHLCVYLRYTISVLNVAPRPVLSHLHEDHFDNLVADHIRKTLPVISTPHACESLYERGHSALYPLETWESLCVVKGNTELTVTSMPGKHTLGSHDPVVANVLQHVPPVMGSMITFKSLNPTDDSAGFNLYISGDTLYYDELKASIVYIHMDRVLNSGNYYIGNPRQISSHPSCSHSSRRHYASRHPRYGDYGCATGYQASLCTGT